MWGEEEGQGALSRGLRELAWIAHLPPIFLGDLGKLFTPLGSARGV